MNYSFAQGVAVLSLSVIQFSLFIYFFIGIDVAIGVNSDSRDNRDQPEIKELHTPGDHFITMQAFPWKQKSGN